MVIFYFILFCFISDMFLAFLVTSREKLYLQDGTDFGKSIHVPQRLRQRSIDHSFSASFSFTATVTVT